MKKKIFLLGMALVFGAALTGCHMKHEWQEANCTKPQTCADCGETQGQALGHDWQQADCTHPRTCSVCGETQGEALGHDWQEDCTHPPTCSVCGETQGEALGHIWMAADCLTPQLCAVCGEMQGELADHDWREADYFTPRRCALCGEFQGEPLQPSFEAHGLTVNARVGETYDYVTCCSADESLTTVGKLTFSDYRIFADSITEGYEWRAVHIKIEFSDDNARDYGMGVYYSNENYYDTEAWDEVYDREDNKKLYTIWYKGKEYTECKSMFSGSGFGEWEDGILTWEGDAFVVVPAGYDGMVVCFRNAALEGKAGDYIYDVADEDTIFFRMGDEDASVIPPVGGADTVSEEEEMWDGEDLDALVQLLSEKLSTQLPREITDKLFDLSSSVALYPFDDHVGLDIKVGKPEYIPDVASNINDFLLENIGENFYFAGTLLIKYVGVKSDGSEDVSSCERWYTKDGIKGEFISNPDKITIDDCTVRQLYEHYADKLGLLDKEQTLAAIKEEIAQNSQTLFYKDASDLSVTVEEGGIVVVARTYKDYLVPVLAGNVTEVVWEAAKKSLLPVGRVRVYCAEDSEDGGADAGTEVYWETADLEAGVFMSAPDGVYEELYTIEDLYEYYEEDFDLMDRAVSGERVED